jgi:hypothetical protein
VARCLPFSNLLLLPPLSPQVDVIEGSRIYIPCIYVVNKIDQVRRPAAAARGAGGGVAGWGCFRRQDCCPIRPEACTPASCTGGMQLC